MKNIVFIDSAEKQFKGNIHMHTTRSDGKLLPEEAIGKFRDAGYDFVMVSDHEIYWDIEDGILKIQSSPIRHAKIIGYDADGFNKCFADSQLFESLEWEINTQMRYFRVELIDENGNKAWLQPVFVEDIL